MSIERWQFEAEDNQIGIIKLSDLLVVSEMQTASRPPLGYLLALLGFTLLDVRSEWLMSNTLVMKGRSPLFQAVAEGDWIPVYDLVIIEHEDDGRTEDAANPRGGSCIELHVITA